GRLYGRDRELARVRAALGAGNRRLVSVVGPAGIGKSSLLGWLAAEFRARQDVALVAAEGVAAVGQLPAAIRRAAGLTGNGGWDVLARQLHARTLLLVLDGYEHLSADLHLLTLLEACPNLRILLGSRRRLELPGQVTIELAGLHVPVESLAEAPA